MLVLCTLLAVVASGTTAQATHAVFDYGTAVDLSDGRPLDGATVSGTIYIGARSSGVSRVTIFVDGNLCAKRSSAPFTCRLDTTTLGNGSHTGRLEVVDSGGGSMYALNVSFSVSSGSPSPTPPPPPPSSDPGVVGQWTAPFSLPVSAIHAQLLPNGKVLLFQRAIRSVGTDSVVWDPQTGETTDVSLTWEREVFCAGHSLLSDGRMLATGGHVYGAPGPSWGPANIDLYDPATGTWTSGPLMSEGRWYPSNVQLADGKTLIFGGKIEPKVLARSVDRYDPAANSITRLPSSADRAFGNYPKLHLLPNGRIPWTNQARTQVFDPATSTWSAGAVTNYGSRGESGNSVLLPGLNKILQVGGGLQGPTATAEIIDFSSPSPAWRYTASMRHARMWANAVLLADGKVLMAGGGQSQFDGPVRAAELFDPATETWTEMASQEGPRQYHSIALLLPDGRVLSAGMDRGSDYAYTGEIYSPPYLFWGPRPTIASAPRSVTYGEQFSISTPEAGSIGRVALVKLGSVTHATDFEQRYVDLSFTADSGNTLRATAPPNGDHAPPGTYMLFVVSSSGVPSVASFVHVS